MMKNLIPFTFVMMNLYAYSMLAMDPSHFDIDIFLKNERDRLVYNSDLSAEENFNIVENLNDLDIYNGNSMVFDFYRLGRIKKDDPVFLARRAFLEKLISCAKTEDHNKDFLGYARLRLATFYLNGFGFYDGKEQTDRAKTLLNEILRSPINNVEIIQNAQSTLKSLNPEDVRKPKKGKCEVPTVTPRMRRTSEKPTINAKVVEPLTIEIEEKEKNYVVQLQEHANKMKWLAPDYRVSKTAPFISWVTIYQGKTKNKKYKIWTSGNPAESKSSARADAARSMLVKLGVVLDHKTPIDPPKSIDEKAKVTERNREEDLMKCEILNQHADLNHHQNRQDFSSKNSIFLQTEKKIEKNFKQAKSTAKNIKKAFKHLNNPTNSTPQYAALYRQIGNQVVIENDPGIQFLELGLFPSETHGAKYVVFVQYFMANEILRDICIFTKFCKSIHRQNNEMLLKLGQPIEPFELGDFDSEKLESIANRMSDRKHAINLPQCSNIISSPGSNLTINMLSPPPISEKNIVLQVPANIPITVIKRGGEKDQTSLQTVRKKYADLLQRKEFLTNEIRKSQPMEKL